MILMQFKVLYLKHQLEAAKFYNWRSIRGAGPPLRLRPERVRAPVQRRQQTALAVANHEAMVLSSRSDRGDSSVKRGTRRRGQRFSVRHVAGGRGPHPAVGLGRPSGRLKDKVQ